MGSGELEPPVLPGDREEMTLLVGRWPHSPLPRASLPGFQMLEKFLEKVWRKILGSGIRQLGLGPGPSQCVTLPPCSLSLLLYNGDAAV